MIRGVTSNICNSHNARCRRRQPCTGTQIVPTETPPPPATGVATTSAAVTVRATTVDLKGAELPPGFSLIKFSDLHHPTAFAFDSQGRMYVTSQEGNVYLLQDDDQDGRADARAIFFSRSYFACWPLRV